MSSAGYDLPSPVSAQDPIDARRIGSSFHDVHLRRRGSPSNGPERRFSSYDAYSPPTRQPPPSRDDYPTPDLYRPNVYRPNRHFSRSPSPERYEPLRAPPEDNSWERPPSWQMSSASPWEARRPRPLLPTLGTGMDWTRTRNDTMASPMFEPSDSWKQTHTESARYSPIDNRFVEFRPRDARPVSPDRARAAGDQFPRGDRYRPFLGTSYREDYPPMSSRSDTYRPIYDYDDDRQPPPPHSADPAYRRDIAGSSNTSRAFSHNEYMENRMPPTPERSMRAASSPRPPRLPRSPITHSKTSSPARVSVPDQEPPRKKLKSRSPSQSSIASSRPSEPLLVDDEAAQDGRSPLVLAEEEEDPMPPASSPSSFSQWVNEDFVQARSSSPTRPGEELADCVEGRNDGSRDGDIPGLASLSKLSMESDMVVDEEINSEKLVPTSEPAIIEPSIDELEPEPLETIAKEQTTPESPPADAVTIAVDSTNAPSPLLRSTSDSSQEVPPETAIHSEQETSAAPTTYHTPEPDAVVHTCAIYKPEAGDIPSLKQARSTRDAVRIIVMTRLLYDRQTREERISPVILANLSISKPAVIVPSGGVEKLVKSFVGEGEKRERMERIFGEIKPALERKFREKEGMLAEKTQMLREEYLGLHERWLAHCARLDRPTKHLDVTSPITEDAAALQNTGRTTRRSAATLGDAVRSDLEMEQIIASLGNDDLTDPSHLAIRNVAIIPDMISVTRGTVDYLFDDTNSLVLNPSEYYGPQTGIHDWTEEEKMIFVEQFAAFPKQFGMIAERLPNKTAAQCVDYYYLHKKAYIDFRKVVSMYAPNKRRRGGRRAGADKQKGGGLLSDIRQHDAEVHKGVSGGAAGPTTRKRRAGVGEASGRKVAAIPARRGFMTAEPTPTSTPEPEGRQRRRRAVNANRVSFAEQDDDEDSVDEKKPKKGRKARKPKSAAIVVEPMDGLGPVVPSQVAGPAASSQSVLAETKFIDQNEVATRRKQGIATQNWPEEDRNLFLSLLAQHGDDFKRIAASMPNKTTIQVSNYYRANLHEMQLDKVAAGAPKRSPTPELGVELWKNIPYPGSGIMSSTPVGGGSNALVNQEQRSPPKVAHELGRETRYPMPGTGPGPQRMVSSHGPPEGHVHMMSGPPPMHDPRMMGYHPVPMNGMMDGMYGPGPSPSPFGPPPPLSTIQLGPPPGMQLPPPGIQLPLPGIQLPPPENLQYAHPMHSSQDELRRIPNRVGSRVENPYPIVTPVLHHQHQHQQSTLPFRGPPPPPHDFRGEPMDWGMYPPASGSVLPPPHQQIIQQPSPSGVENREGFHAMNPTPVRQYW